jgi:hypothetical protein
MFFCNKMIDRYSETFLRRICMKYLLALILCLCCTAAFGQYYVPAAPVYYTAPPMYYAPAPAPVYYDLPTYYYRVPVYAPPVYRYYPYVYRTPVYAPPVVYGPRVWVSPKVYVEGQPVRNFIRAFTP